MRLWILLLFIMTSLCRAAILHVPADFAGIQAADQFPVFPLIQEKTGFLSGSPIDMESIAVFKYLRLILGAPQIAVLDALGVSLGQGFPAFVVDGRQRIAENLLQGLRQGVPDEVHADGVALNNGHTGVPIDDEPRQAVAFGVNKPEAVCCIRPGQAYCKAIIGGVLNPAGPE